MADEFNTELFEQERARRFNDASERLAELEQKRLNDIFATFGGVETHDSLSFTQDEFSTLDKVRSSVEAGDRKAMLALLAIMTDSLRAFEVLPQKVREALADGLEKMRGGLEESRGFLPRKRGKRPEKWVREHSKKEFFTAMAVEYRRVFDGYTLEDAIAKVSEEWGLKDSLIQKRWKRHHKDVRSSLDAIGTVMGMATVPRRAKKRQP